MLDGEQGDDTLIGRSGNDSLNGGIGTDTALDLGDLLQVNIEFSP